MVLSTWCQWLAPSHVYKTIRSYLRNVIDYQTLHIGGGSVEITQLPLLSVNLDRIRRRSEALQALRQVEQQYEHRRPVTRAHMLELLVHLDLRSPVDATVWAAACTALYGLLRCGEFTTQSGVRFDPTFQATRRGLVKRSGTSGTFYTLHLPSTK